MQKIFKPDHQAPLGFTMEYILLPYGHFYERTKVFLKAKKGDTLHFFDGLDKAIVTVKLIPQDRLCDLLCQMRYGISWRVAFQKWCQYAELQGHGKDILSKTQCIIVFYEDLPNRSEADAKGVLSSKRHRRSVL